jgi:hypothetical protein
MEYTLTLGTRFHQPKVHFGLYSALLAAEAAYFVNLPVFIYDDCGMVAAVGTDCRAQIYDTRLRRAMLRQPAFTRLRIL